MGEHRMLVVIPHLNEIDTVATRLDEEASI